MVTKDSYQLAASPPGYSWGQKVPASYVAFLHNAPWGLFSGFQAPFSRH